MLKICQPIKFWNERLRAVFGSLLPLMFSFSVVAQTLETNQENNEKRSETRNLPEWILLDWQMIDSEIDELSRLRPSFDAALMELARTIDPTIGPLTKDQLPPKEQPQNNLSQDTLMSSMPKLLVSTTSSTKLPSNGSASAKNSSKTIAPLFIQMGKSRIIGIVLIHTESQQVLSFSHRIIDSNRWTAQLENEPTRPLQSSASSPPSNPLRAQTMLSELLQSMSQSMTETPILPRRDMAVSLDLRLKDSARSNLNQQLLGLLLAQKLLENDDVITPIGTEDLTSIHAVWNIKSKARRATRRLSGFWSEDRQSMASENSKASETSDTSERRILWNFELLDGVFGKRIPWSLKDSSTLTTQDNQYQFSIPSKITEVLSPERNSLKQGELPKVVYIYGAWAYLDKGRAWGLKMNDRLVISDQSETIKGHIVNYFGPEAKLKSSRGWPIHDGAIMFVRKGQREVKIGEEMTFDRLTVPTPWPPPSSK